MTFTIPTDNQGNELAPILQSHGCKFCKSRYDAEGNPLESQAYNPADPTATTETVFDLVCNRDTCKTADAAAAQAAADAVLVEQADAQSAALAAAQKH